MSNSYRTRKERAQFLIRQFARELGYAISRPSWQERPDALLTFGRGKVKKRIALEHTDYFNDTASGQMSPLTPIGEFWALVQGSLIRRISHRRYLGGIVGSIRFRRNPALPAGKGRAGMVARQSTARQLAEEICEFLQTCPVTKDSGGQIFDADDIACSPAMASLLSSLHITRAVNEEMGASRCNWSCSNIAAGCMGVDLTYITTSIEAKNKKAKGYDWGDAEEKWLLIVAGGPSANGRAGPIGQDVDWDDPVLARLCRETPFDRIAFWERVSSWIKWLKG